MAPAKGTKWEKYSLSDHLDEFNGLDLAGQAKWFTTARQARSRASKQGDQARVDAIDAAVTHVRSSQAPPHPELTDLASEEGVEPWVEVTGSAGRAGGLVPKSRRLVGRDVLQDYVRNLPGRDVTVSSLEPNTDQSVGIGKFRIRSINLSRGPASTRLRVGVGKLPAGAKKTRKIQGKPVDTEVVSPTNVTVPPYLTPKEQQNADVVRRRHALKAVQEQAANLPDMPATTAYFKELVDRGQISPEDAVVLHASAVRQNPTEMDALHNYLSQHAGHAERLAMAQSRYNRSARKLADPNILPSIGEVASEVNMPRTAKEAAPDVEQIADDEERTPMMVRRRDSRARVSRGTLPLSQQRDVFIKGLTTQRARDLRGLRALFTTIKDGDVSRLLPHMEREGLDADSLPFPSAITQDDIDTHGSVEGALLHFYNQRIQAASDQGVAHAETHPYMVAMRRDLAAAASGGGDAGHPSGGSDMFQHFGLVNGLDTSSVKNLHASLGAAIAGEVAGSSDLRKLVSIPATAFPDVDWRTTGSGAVSKADTGMSVGRRLAISHRQLVEAGMSPVDAVRAASSVADLSSEDLHDAAASSTTEGSADEHEAYESGFAGAVAARVGAYRESGIGRRYTGGSGEQAIASAQAAASARNARGRG